MRENKDAAFSSHETMAELRILRKHTILSSILPRTVLEAAPSDWIDLDPTGPSPV